MTRTCSDCRITKPTSEFTARNYYCKPCFAARCRVYRRRNPSYRAAVDRWRARNPRKCKEARRKRGYLERHGISLQEFQRMFDAQNGKCANPGCGRILLPDGLKTNSPTLDHNHKTMKLRGILCARCNKGLGWFDDDIEKMIGIIEYLSRYDT